MEKEYQVGKLLRAVGALVLAGAGLLVDLSGFGVGFASGLYVAAVYVSLGLPGRRPALGMALASSGLLVLAAFSTAPAPSAQAVLERLGCILFIALALKVVLTGKRAAEELDRKEHELRVSAAEGTSTLTAVLERLRDEGERRRSAEAAVRESQERFNLAVIGSRDGIWDWFDVEREEQWWSPRLYQLLGYGPGEIQPSRSTFRDILHPDDRERTFKAVEEHLAGRAEYQVEYRLRTKSKDYRWFQVRGTVFRGEHQRPTRMTGTVSDIHDRKLSAENVRRSNQRFERAVRGTSDGLWEWKVGTDEAWYAPRFKELLGYGEDALDDTVATFQGRIHPDDHAAVMEAIRRHLKYGEPFDCEHRLLTASKEYLWFRVRGVAERDEAGRAVRLAGSLQDVTASKHYLIELEQAQQTTQRQAMELKRQSEELAAARDEALESVRLKSEFLATMSHEIRTPMNGVIGMTGLLLDTELDLEQRDCAETIRLSADSLLTIINDILDFSKIEAGRLSVESFDFDLVQTVESAVDLVADRALSKRVELATIFAVDIPRKLKGDPGRLRQIVVNLVGNAVKFTEEGKIVVRVERVSEDDNETTLRFGIADTGIGLSEQQQKRLFEPFVQAEGGTTRRYGGTGLGLAISKQLTGMMNGEIGVASRLGHGSTFWFTAVFTKLGKEAAPFCELPIPPQQLLVVAPRPVVAEVVESGVAGASVPVQWVADAKQAAAILRNPSPRVDKWTVLLDAAVDSSGVEELLSLFREPIFAESHSLVVLRPLSVKPPFDLTSVAHLTLTKPLKQGQLVHCLRAADQAPSQRANGPTQPAVSKSSKSKRKTRVLVADDNVVNQKVALKMLDKLGYSAEAVANGSEAVQAHRDVGYDLILMDCHMPEMDGFQATEEIRSSSLRARAPIIALTASVLPADRTRCAEAGMDDFIKKPVDFEVLGETLEKWERESRRTTVDSQPLGPDGHGPEDQGSLTPVTTNRASPGLTTGN
jgi:PAS domain S-box-containing protein